MESLDHILLFKTSCCRYGDKQVVKSLMENELKPEEWNLDQDDCDRVLRVVSGDLRHDQVIQLMKNNGYECCELK